MRKFRPSCTYINSLFIRSDSFRSFLVSSNALNQQLVSKKYSSSVRDENIQSFKQKIENGPSLQQFIINSPSLSTKYTENEINVTDVPYLDKCAYWGNGQKVFFDTYGCQMNVNDTEIAWSILHSNGYEKASQVKEADVILMMTCSIRDSAEHKLWNVLTKYKTLLRKRKHRVKIGILGCMAERLKKKILEKEKAVDVVCGPDAYKDLPRLLAQTQSGQSAVNVMLSLEETYADIMPIRLNQNSKTAFVSITRGCNNMCSYCIVPFTRGRERSRPMSSILEEVRKLSDQGIKEVTLLGQNVNSYCDRSEEDHYGGYEVQDGDHKEILSSGFNTIYKIKRGGKRFGDLLDQVSRIDPNIRVRFTSPHPKDFPDEVLHLIKERGNICKGLHLPAQSGNNEVLQNMRRGYTREAYLELVHHIRDIVPDVKFTSDFIIGFCGETEEAFKDSLSLVEQVGYSFIYFFPYSMRQKTHAYHHLKDTVPQEIKIQRQIEFHEKARKGMRIINESQIGQEQLILIEGVSKRSESDMWGRNDAGNKVIIPNNLLSSEQHGKEERNVSIGDYIVTKIVAANSQTLHGKPLFHSSLVEFNRTLEQEKQLNMKL